MQFDVMMHNGLYYVTVCACVGGDIEERHTGNHVQLPSQDDSTSPRATGKDRYAYYICTHMYVLYVCMYVCMYYVLYVYMYVLYVCIVCNDEGTKSYSSA